MDLFNAFPTQFLRYSKGIDAIRRSQCGSIRARPELVVCVGRPGVGKTTRIVSEVKSADSNEVPDCHFQNDTQWWDGYTGQANVVLDDFRGWIPLHLFLKLIDVVPVKLPVKGSFTTWFTTKRVYISSNFMPAQWWKDLSDNQYGAITRRISKLIIFDEDREVQEWTTHEHMTAWDQYLAEGTINSFTKHLAFEEEPKSPVTADYY